MDIHPLMKTSETEERRKQLDIYTEKTGEYMKKYSISMNNIINYSNVSTTYYKGEMYVIDRSTIALFERYLDSLEKGLEIDNNEKNLIKFYMTRLYDVYLLSIEISGKEKKMDVLDIMGHENEFLMFRDVVEYYISILYFIVNTQDELFFDIEDSFN
jgi:hypothetical protein